MRDTRRHPVAALAQALGVGQADLDQRIRQTAWVARCVGRGAAAPLGPGDITAMAHTLHARSFERDAVVFTAGMRPAGVWIVRAGPLELSVGSGHRRLVVHVLRPGDVDGDIPLLLDLPLPYTSRALDDASCLFLAGGDFDALLAARPQIARRWLSSIAQRLAASQDRVLSLLGRSLPEQVARLLLDEATDGFVHLPQRTLAAMLGVQRPSLNKVLKQFEDAQLIAIRYAEIELLDPAGLTRRAA